MQDNNPDRFNEPLEEDFDDLDDLDDLEDFSDEDIANADWDEDFDDDEIVDSEPLEAPSPRKKSFFMKNFNVIIVLLALSGGGFYVYTKFGASILENIPKNAQTTSALLNAANTNVNAEEDNSQIIAELSDTGLSAKGNVPPMPLPLNSVKQERSVSKLDVKKDNSLTPLPQLTNIELEELPALNIETQEHIEFQEPSAENENFNAIDTVDGTAEPERFSETIQNIAPPENIAVAENTPVVTSIVTPAVIKPQVTKEDLQKINDKFTKLNVALIKKTKLSDKKLDALIASVNALERQLSNVTSQLQEQNRKLTDIENKPAPEPVIVRVPEPVPAPVVVSSPASSTPVQNLVIIPEETETEVKVEVETKTKTENILPEPLKTVKTAPRPKAPAKITSWKLRSAQPGKATLSPQNSSDLKNVEVGDILNEIGRIQSISNKTGRWIVQGTKGHISQ